MTLADEPSPRDTPDRVFRRSLRHPEHLRAFLQQAVPDFAAGFDCDRARLLDREFPLDERRRREADLPFEIPYRTGDEEITALVCLLLEHQSDTDPMMPLRLFYFASVYWDRQWHAWESLARPRPPLRLHPVVPIVLYTGAAPWGSNRTLTDLLGEPAAFHAFAPTWRPIFWNLADQTAQGLLDSGREWLQTLAVIRVEGAAEAEFRAVYEEAVRRLRDLRGRDQVRWYDLMRIVLTWAAWRRPRAEQPALWAAAEASQAEPGHQQEVRIMAQTAVEAWIEEGMAKGQVLNARTMLQTLLKKRFGDLPDALVEQINATNDLERLQAAFEQAIQLVNLVDLNI